MEDKGEMLKKLLELKKEFTRKKRKLDKVKRASSVKAHVRQKIQEHENMEKDTDSTVLSIRSKDLFHHSHLDVSVLNSINEVAQIQEDETNTCHNSSGKSIMTETISQSEDFRHVDSALAKPHSRTSKVEFKTAKMNYDMRQREQMTLTDINSVCTPNLPEQMISECDSRDSSSTLKNNTPTVVLKRSRQVSSCDNFIQNNKIHKVSKSRINSGISSLLVNNDWHAATNNEVSILPNITVYKSLIPSLENETDLTPCAYGKELEFVRNNRNTSVTQDLQSQNVDDIKCDIKLTDSVNDKGFQPKDVRNQLFDRGQSVHDSVRKIEIIQCNTSNDMQIMDNTFMSIDCVSGKEICVKTKMTDSNQQLFEIAELPTEHFVSDNNKSVIKNVKDLVATSVCIKNSQQFVSCTDSITDKTSDSDTKNDSCKVLPVLLEYYNLPAVTDHLSRSSVKNTDSLISDVDENKKSVKESSMSNESDKDIVKASQISMATQRSHICGRRKSLSLTTIHFQNSLPLTPSFESPTAPLNKNILKALSKSGHSVPNPEPVTDSEFFNILELTQTDGEALRYSGTKDVKHKRQKCESLSPFNQTSRNVDLEALHISNCSKHISATEVLGGKPFSGGLQSDSSLMKVCDLSAGESNNTNWSQTVPDTEAFSSENPFTEYTELDAIPYSQFELTEDFLSETQNSQESMKNSSNKGKSSGALVKRRSSRISSFHFTQSEYLSHTASLLSSQSANIKCGMSKKRKSHAQQEKVAAVLSVFQFLIDEARKTNSSAEFELPKSFDTLKSNRIESTVKLSYFFEGHIFLGNEERNIEIQREGIRNENNVVCNKSVFQKDFHREPPSSCKKDTELRHNYTAEKEFVHARNEDLTKEPEAIDVYKNIAQNIIFHPGTTEDLSIRKQQTKNAEEQEISYVFMRDEKTAPGETIDDCLLDNTKDLMCNIIDVNTSDSLKTTPSLRRRNMRVSKLRRKLFNSSGDKTVAKKLFAVKSAGPHGSSSKIPGDREAVISKTHSTDTKVFAVERCSHPKDKELSFKFSCQTSRVNTCSNEWTTLLQNKTSILRPESPEIVHEAPRTQNTLPLHSPDESFQVDATTSEKLLRPFKKSVSFTTTHTNLPNMDSVQTPSTSGQLGSPHFNSSFTHTPFPVTPFVETCHHQISSQISSAFSLTSTPKTIEDCRTGPTIPIPDFDISFNDCEKSEYLESGELPLERNEHERFKQHCPQYNLSSSPSKSVPSDLSIVLNNQILNLDESSLSPAQIPINADKLYTTPVPAIKDLPVDVSIISSAADRSNISESEVSGLFATSSNIITPWKKLPKTASTPVLVIEKDDSKACLSTPIFSSNVKRSRTKLSSYRGNASQNILRFSGCFQCCTQDAVVSLLTGVLKTKESKLKEYIIIVQATSLTVWTEDDLNGWTAELDWRLSPDIHVMKACLLPRSDAVIAVVASGWEKNSLFATMFVYDWSTEDTARFNIPLLEQQNVLKSASQIELCPFLATEVHIALTSHTHHTVGSVVFTNSLRAVQSLSMFGVHRGKLINMVAIKGQISANVTLTGDQEVSIWNMKIGIVLKKIKLQYSIPCLTGLLGASSYKGILLLDTVWRVDDGDCGGIIAVNPLTGHTQKIKAFLVPNNTWRSVESAKSGDTLVTAISDKGSLGVWDRTSGALLGYTKSRITTCASQLAKHLIVGEIHGCLHMYSASN